MAVSMRMLCLLTGMTLCSSALSTNNGICNSQVPRTVSTTRYGAESYRYRYRCRGIFRCTRTGYRKITITAYLTRYEQRFGCCSGYSASGTNQCQDNNECASLSTNNCQQKCVNTLGSYSCSCYSGYILKYDGRTCQDMNECDGNHDCQQRCNNTPGSYVCSCDPGYALNSDGRTCRDINECDSQPCEHTCENTVGSFECNCTSGYVVNINGLTCDDIDECSSNITQRCEHNCTNTLGSYNCSCNDGFALKEDSSTCGATCDPDCENGGTCSSPNTCNCTEGYTGDTCGQAICNPDCENNGTCSAPNICDCTEGYTGHTCTQESARVMDDIIEGSAGAGVLLLLLLLTLVIVAASVYFISKKKGRFLSVVHRRNANSGDGVPKPYEVPKPVPTRVSHDDNTACYTNVYDKLGQKPFHVHMPPPEYNKLEIAKKLSHEFMTKCPAYGVPLRGNK